MNEVAIKLLNRHVDLASGVAFMCLIVLIWTLIQNYQMQADVLANRTLIIERTDVQTKLTLEYIDRIANRWDKLQAQNPELIVPTNGHTREHKEFLGSKEPSPTP